MINNISPMPHEGLRITFDDSYVEEHYEDFMDEDMRCLTMTKLEAIELRDKLEDALDG